MALEQDTDDAWNLFNLINIGDMIKGSAYRYDRYFYGVLHRKIQKETHTGMVSNIKKRFDCVIRVEVDPSLTTFALEFRLRCGIGCYQNHGAKCDGE